MATSHSPEVARRQALALSLVTGVGAVAYRELAERFGSASLAWERGGRLPGRDAAMASATEALSRAAKCGASLVLLGDPEYPEPLSELTDPPPRLFALGTLGALRRPCVAIVGTRSATSYGERVTRQLASALADAGATVVSGLARGIDAAAHRAALEAGGSTVAVLGTGVDVAYPAAHHALHAEVARRGLLLSEELPGARPTAGSFPKRNRIIAGLARATIVVEAGVRSGALITANAALDLGRSVAAVPGPIDAPQSAGSNELLRDGAIVINGVADALTLLGLPEPRPSEIPRLGTEAEQAVWQALAAGAVDVDRIAQHASLPARECLAAISALEVAGVVDISITGEIRRRGVTPSG